MSEDKPDNDKLRDKFYHPLNSTSYVLHSPNQDTINLQQTLHDEGSTSNDEPTNLWWLNTRRRCHRHVNIKRNTLRRKH